MHPPEAEEGWEERETSGLSKSGFWQSPIPQTLLAAERGTLQPCVNCACPRGLGTAYQEPQTQPLQCGLATRLTE